MYTVLIVEDEKRMREIVTTYFESAGYNVLEASNGLEAIDLFENETVDLVLLDIMMPQIDGWTVCKRLRTKSDIPIIIITARSEMKTSCLDLTLGRTTMSPNPSVQKSWWLVQRPFSNVLKGGSVAMKA